MERIQNLSKQNLKAQNLSYKHKTYQNISNQRQNLSSQNLSNSKTYQTSKFIKHQPSCYEFYQTTNILFFNDT